MVIAYETMNTGQCRVYVSVFVCMMCMKGVLSYLIIGFKAAQVNMFNVRNRGLFKTDT